MKKMILAAAMAFECGLAAFGDTWTDAKGVTWEFNPLYFEDVVEAEIMGASPAPSGVLTIPGKVEGLWGSYTVTKIGNSAFKANSAITGVVIPTSVRNIDGFAFQDCTGITSIAIPASVKNIDGFAFQGCTGITSLAIPASVTNIVDWAFDGCSNLKSVTFKGDVPCFKNFAYAFNGTPFLAGIEAKNGHDDIANPKKISGASSELKDENFAAESFAQDMPNVFVPEGNATKWYEWTAPKSGTAWFWAQGNFNTFLEAYAYDGLTVLAHNDNFNGKASAISFSVKAGTKCLICVGGVKPRHLGSYTLKWRVGAPVNVTFDTCGGTMNVDSGATVFPVPKGAAVGALPTATKTYYTFAGWYTKKSGGTKVTASTKFSKATKVYAHWAKKKFKVTVAKGDGAKATTGSGSYAWGTKVKLTATPKPGYVFMKWELTDLGDDVSKAAFPKFSTQCRKNLKPTVTVPKTSGISYTATFVKKTLDTLSLTVDSGSTTLYAEDGAGSVDLWALSSSYATFTTSKLPAGVKFAFRPNSDSVCRLEIVNPDKVPAGRHVIKVTAKNRSGKAAAKSIVVFGKNRTQAIDKGALAVSASTSAKTPNEINAGTKYTLAELGVSAASGWKITKISGLPSGITWDAKSQKLKGYTAKTGTYTFTFTVTKGKTSYAATATFKVLALPAKAVGTFNGYVAPYEYGTFFNASSRKVTVSVTSAGKVTAKLGSLSFSCNGLTSDHAGGFKATVKSETKTAKSTRTRTLNLLINPSAGFDENSLTGTYSDSLKTKDSSGGMSFATSSYNIIGRKNVFGCDANSNLRFEGADLAQDALDRTMYYGLRTSVIAFAGGTVTVTLDDRSNGLATLSGTIDGKPFSESAVVWYEPVNETKAYLTIYSFRLGMPICYLVTLVTDEYGTYADTVAAPALPLG